MEAFRAHCRVTAVAPVSEQSAVGRAITFRQPLRLEQRLAEADCQIFAVSGTPTDCVLIALCHLLDEPPDVVVSGVNSGPNLGDDILYSGTVAGAMEGSVNGLPSIAVSRLRDASTDYGYAARFAYRLAKAVVVNGLPPKVLLNVNVPALAEESIRGYRITRQGHTLYSQRVIRRVDPRGQEYFWVSGALPTGEPEPGTDFEAVFQNFVSVTPLSMDLTSQPWLEKLATWNI